MNSIIEILKNRSKETPNKKVFTFLKDGEDPAGELTFSDLNSQSLKIAASLSKLTQPGDRVVLLYDQGLDFILSFYACLHCGLIAIPVGTPTKRERLKRTKSIFNNAMPSLVLCTSKFLEDKKFKSFRSEFSLCNWTSIDQLKSEDAFPMIQFEPQSETIAYLQYTSGSTGNPKGNIIDHENIINNLASLQSYLLHNSQSVCVSWLPFFHDLGLVYGLLQPVYSGYHCVLMSPLSFTQNPFRWLNAISNYQATHSAAPSFAYELCLDIPAKQLEGLDLSSWEATINGAELIRASVIEKFNKAFRAYGWKETSWNPSYGLAEMTLVATSTPIGKGITTFNLKDQQYFDETQTIANQSKKLIGCGTINEYAEMRIVNPSSFEQVVEGEIGEIWLGGKSVAKGYWNNPEATEKTFNAKIKNEKEVYLRTGDLGFIRNNELFFVSRIKELIILNGENFYPTDLEQVVENSDPAIRKTGVCAFSVTMEEREKVVLICEINRTAIKGLDTAKLVKKIRSSMIEILGVKISTIYFIRPMALPRTTSGKIKRVECRKEILKEDLKYIAVWKEEKAPKKEISNFNKNKLVKNLCEHLARVCRIKVSEIEVSEPFSYCGMDSILATTFAQELSKQFNTHISPTLFYNYPNVELLAEYLDGTFTPQSIPSDLSKSSKEGAGIAVIGMGCRFPGANSIDEFWDLLIQGKSTIQKYPKDRWNHNTNASEEELPAIAYAGVLSEVDLFDPGFFGISPREAVVMDPQQRLLLEVTWEALQDAGIKPSSLENTKTGVYIGISTNDYADLAIHENSPIHAITGNSLSIAAARISYLLNLKGPSVSIDTACSSSLVAVNRALKDLHDGVVDLAIVGGVNLLLNPDVSVVFARNKMISPNGTCSTFDNRANGYVRSEGCGLVVLKRHKECLNTKQNIWALIQGVAVNQDGKSNGITAPNGRSQREVIEQALKSANIDPNQLSLIEAHGTGTPLGDPIEVNTLVSLLDANLPKSTNTCWLSSVKANLGHLESAAGIAGLMKAVLCLHNKLVVPQVNFSTINSEIILNQESRLKIPREIKQLNKNQRLFAGVSSFGFGGTNAHVILQNAAVIPAYTNKKEAPSLVLISAKSENSLNILIQKYIEQKEKWSSINLESLSYGTIFHRDVHRHSLGIVAQDMNEFWQLLEAPREDKSEDIFTVENYKNKAKNMAWVFSGQGGQYAKMGLALYERETCFKNAIDECAAVLRLQEIDLIEILFGVDSEEYLNKPTCLQLALFSTQYALARLLMSWNVHPDVLIGHSLGEYVAACIAGVFKLPDALKMVRIRATLFERIPKGSMAIVFSEKSQLTEMLSEYQNSVSVAVCNSENSIVISGETNPIKEILDYCNKRGISNRLLNIPTACHSPMTCLLYTSPSPRDATLSRMPSSA